MIRYAITDIDGMVTFLGQGPELPSGALVLPDNISLSDAATMMLSGADWLPRPQLPVPAWADPGPVTAAGLPPGATLTVTDLETGEVLAVVPEATGAIEVTLPDPGPYLLSLRAPLPWLPSERRIEVMA